MTDSLFYRAAITPGKLCTYPSGSYVSSSTPATILLSDFAASTGGHIDRCAQAVRGVCRALE
jgi:hypothetical protein